MSALPQESVVSSIRLQSGKGGFCRVFIVQTRNRAEVNHAQQIFGELEEFCSVRPLALGVTTAFAVQTTGDLPVLQDLEALLKADFKFSVIYGGFNPIIHRIVEDLAVESGSRLFRIPDCRSCGDAVPFPATLSLHGPGGIARAKALLCDRCVAAVGGDREAEDLCRLAGSSNQALTITPATSVVRRRSLLRFRSSRSSPAGAAGRRDHDEAPSDKAPGQSSRGIVLTGGSPEQKRLAS